MKALKTTIPVTELQKTLGLWKSRKITDSVIPKLLHLYLGMTAYSVSEKKSMERMKIVWNKRNYLLNYCLAPFRQTYHKIILLEKADVQPWI